MSFKSKLKKFYLQKKKAYDEWRTINIYTTCTTADPGLLRSPLTQEERERIKKLIATLDD